MTTSWWHNTVFPYVAEPVEHERLGFLHRTSWIHQAVGHRPSRGLKDSCYRTLQSFAVLPSAAVVPVRTEGGVALNSPSRRATGLVRSRNKCSARDVPFQSFACSSPENTITSIYVHLQPIARHQAGLACRIVAALLAASDFNLVSKN